jgi:hypothetical protein
VPGAHPELVTHAVFAAVQVALEHRRWKRTTPQLGGGEWVLSGLLRCGDCETTMYGKTEVQRRQRKGGVKEYTYRKYFCSANSRHGKGTCRCNSVLQSAVIGELVKELKRIHADPARLAELAGAIDARASSADDGAAAELAALRKRAAELDKSIKDGEDNVLLAPPHLVGRLSARLDEWIEERRAIGERVETLDRARAAAQGNAAEVRDALAVLAELEGAIDELPARELRRVLERLVTRVVVVFDHSRPPNQCQASAFEVTFHPDVAKLLDSGSSS